MRLTVKRTDLDRGLGVVARAVPSRSTIPLCMGIYIGAEGERLTLMATDIGETIQTVVACQCEESGSIVLPAKQLIELVKKAPEDAVVIETNGMRAKVIWSGAEYSLSGWDGTQFPILKPTNDESFTVDQAELRKLIGRTEFVVAGEPVKPFMRGCGLRIRDGVLSSLATDNAAIAYATMKVDHAAEEQGNIPAEACRDLAKLLTEGTAKVTFLASGMRVEIGETIFETRLLGEPFPDLISRVPLETVSNFRANRGDMLDAMDRTSSVNHKTRFSLKDGTVGLYTQTADGSSTASDQFPAVMESGKPISVILDCDYLRKYLNALDGPGVLVSGVTDAKPFKVSQHGDDTGYFVVLPRVTF